MKPEINILPGQIQRFGIFGIYSPSTLVLAGDFLDREGAEKMAKEMFVDVTVAAYARNAKTPNEHMEARLWQRLQKMP